MNKQNVKYECRVDWDEIFQQFPDAPTPQYLKHTWQNMKRKVATQPNLTHSEVMKILLSFYSKKFTSTITFTQKTHINVVRHIKKDFKIW